MKWLVVAICLAGAQGRTLYEDPTRSIRIYGYSSAEGGTNANGDFEFQLVGNPATVESRLQGMTLQGSIASGVVAPARSEKEPAFIRSLNVDGPAVLTLDSALMYQAQRDNAARFGTKAPEEPKGTDTAKLTTDRFVYSGTGSDGIFTIPNAFRIEARSEGQTPSLQYQQTMTATGSKATINLDPAAISTIPIETGTISGPVKVHIDRTETALGKPSEKTIMDGEADQVVLDLKSERAITLTGNVKVRGESGLYLGTSEGDTVVIFLDESLKPIRVRVTGSPTKSTLRDKSAGGGGK
ncbi:MAG TPA: hypothetical protein VJ835_12130 [Fimbriimonadaceae bacterium]|nr:hypothetical protein [Fimbriimonadaceae bacterium]